MPYRQEWVEPERILEHKEVVIYRAYDEDDADDPLTYWFTTDSLGEHEFDVRDLANPNNHSTETDDGRKAIIRDAIERGDLKSTEDES